MPAVATRVPGPVPSATSAERSDTLPATALLAAPVVSVVMAVGLADALVRLATLAAVTDICPGTALKVRSATTVSFYVFTLSLLTY